MLRRIGAVRYRGETHEFSCERITNEPFDLRSHPRYALVIDRLSWWYDVPREWLKKTALMNNVYLLNNPFTFQAMEKHSAYCAMMRLGLKVPETWLIPHKLPPDNPRYMPMAELYSPAFDLDAIAERIGYPLFMKPFNGGTWVGVTRVADGDELRRSYDESGERLMHLQAAVENYEVFTRTLSIGPQTLVTRFDPSQHGHYRYVVDHEFLAPELEREVATISRLVNAFFRWEFNSCEVIVKDGQAHPIDYANASPDVALVSLHYYFPWAIRSLTAWCIFCTVTGRSMRIHQDTGDYFEIGDRADLAYEEKLERRGDGQLPPGGKADRVLPGRRLPLDGSGERVLEESPCNGPRPFTPLDELMVEYVGSPEFDDLVVHAIRLEVEPERQEEMIERSRRLVQQWAGDQVGAAGAH